MERAKQKYRRLREAGAARWLARSTSARLRKRPQEGFAAHVNIVAEHYGGQPLRRTVGKVVPFSGRPRRRR